MSTHKLYVDIRRVKKDGSYPIKLLVTHIGSFMISLGMDVQPEHWDGSGYNRKAQDYKTRNAMLRSKLAKVDGLFYRLESGGMLLHMTDRQLKQAIEEELNPEKRMKTLRLFTSYIDEYISHMNETRSRSLYVGTKNKLMAYDPNCTLESMDRRWLKKFEQWMKDGGLSVNGMSLHLRNIRAVFNYCNAEEYTNLYPFRGFKIKHEPTRKRSMTADQLRQLRDYPCRKAQEEYRDIFMLMFYLIGINAKDLLTAKPEQLVDGRLEYRRAKTGKLYSIKVEPEAMEIIDKYKGKDHLLSVAESYKDYLEYLRHMNPVLKKIGMEYHQYGGYDKKTKPIVEGLSTYYARHTWATIAADLDVTFEVISAALGHSIANPTTAIYINFNQKKVDEANRKVIDYLNG